MRVVAALIEKDNKYLIANRSYGNLENKWEFPHVKVEQNETDSTAIERKIKGAFDIQIKVDYFISNEISENIDLNLYKCNYLSGEINLNAHKDIKFVTLKELLDYDLEPLYLKLATLLQSFKEFKKLVRDKIPNKIEKNGEIALIKTLNNAEYQQELKSKLYEEYLEVIKSKSNSELIEELADVEEVIEAIVISSGYTIEDLNKIKKEKVIKRGSFKDKIYLNGSYKK